MDVVDISGQNLGMTSGGDGSKAYSYCTIFGGISIH